MIKNVKFADKQKGLYVSNRYLADHKIKPDASWTQLVSGYIVTGETPKKIDVSQVQDDRSFDYLGVTDKTGNRWLRVPHEDFVDFGLLGQTQSDVTKYSPTFIYLGNEDSDLFINKLINKLGESAISVKIKEVTQSKVLLNDDLDENNLLTTFFRGRRFVNIDNNRPYLVDNILETGRPKVKLMDEENNSGHAIPLSSFFTHFRKDPKEVRQLDIKRYIDFGEFKLNTLPLNEHDNSKVVNNLKNKPKPSLD